MDDGEWQHKDVVCPHYQLLHMREDVSLLLFGFVDVTHSI